MQIELQTQSSLTTTASVINVITSTTNELLVNDTNIKIINNLENDICSFNVKNYIKL